jgi:ABC-2 type transport system permease protein
VIALRRMVWVELKLFLREPLTVVFAVVLPLIILVVMAGVFGNVPDPEYYRGYGPMDFYTPAYVGLVVAAIGLVSIPAHLAGNRERGVLRRFQASSVPVGVVAGAEALVSLVIALVSSAVLVTCAMLAYRVGAPDSLPLLVAAFLLTALMFVAVGVVLGSLIPTARAAQAAGVLAWFLMLMVGGAGPPPESLTGVLGVLSYAIPLTYASRLLQAAWLEGAWGWADAGIVAAIGLTVSVVSARLFRWE